MYQYLHLMMMIHKSSRQNQIWNRQTKASKEYSSITKVDHLKTSILYRVNQNIRLHLYITPKISKLLIKFTFSSLNNSQIM